MNNLFEYAKQYNQFGFNVIPLKITDEGKKPASGKWKHLQSSEQSMADLNKLNWNDGVNGIGGINNSITSIDFDKCEDESFVLNFAKELGINSWIVKTGFGYHIHFRVKDIDNTKNMMGDKGVYRCYPKDKSVLSHCEVRIKDCYTALPPSKHYNGSFYEFISGEPQNPPERVSSKKLLDILQKHFAIEFDISSMKGSKCKEELLEAIDLGVTKGTRHKILVSYFSLLFKREFSKDFILLYIKDWNKKNKPSLDDNEIVRQVNDLWRRYSKGLSGKFHEFENILLVLDYEIEKKLKMILCYSIIEYNSDDRILNELGLDSIKKQYHKECKDFIEENDNRTKKKDQIIRVGEDLIVDVIKGKVKYPYFSVYLGIVSFLGRQLKAKRISNDIIAYRAIGYKNFNDWYESESTKMPPSRYIINKAVEYLEEAGYIRTFYLKKGQMKFYSTRLKTKKEVAQFAMNCKRKKIRGQIEEEKLRERMNNEIHGLEIELEKLKKMNDSNGLSIHC
jgi:hypothetical protein